MIKSLLKSNYSFSLLYQNISGFFPACTVESLPRKSSLLGFIKTIKGSFTKYVCLCFINNQTNERVAMETNLQVKLRAVIFIFLWLCGCCGRLKRRVPSPQRRGATGSAWRPAPPHISDRITGGAAGLSRWDQRCSLEEDKSNNETLNPLYTILST